MTSPASLDKTEQNFEAEVSQLLKLMVHSVYSNKDIFLRELISNAADACEKLRYLAIQDPALLGDAGDLKITLKSDESGKTLTVIDNGIGMNREDLTANLGTIARSGTKAFLEGLEEKGDGSALIGQFGVGFYSAFMVAGTVTVYSRKAGEKGVSRWTSSGEGTFTVEAVEAGPDGWSGPGTIVILTLNEEASEYANPQKVEDIVRA
ncbi:MAG: ATP-binding protein, partial [Pseudomonadota bacterium]